MWIKKLLNGKLQSVTNTDNITHMYISEKQIIKKNDSCTIHSCIIPIQNYLTFSTGLGTIDIGPFETREDAVYTLNGIIVSLLQKDELYEINITAKNVE